MRSSYMVNNFDRILENTVFAFSSMVAVELGVLDGYSTISIANGLLKVTKYKKGGRGHLYAYDLWEDYEYNHGDMDKVRNGLKNSNVSEYVTLYKKDAFTVHADYEDNSVDFLHIDISNTGSIIREMVKLWTPKLRHCGLFLFEGGSIERDNIEWMKKYNKEPIRDELDSNPIIKENYIYGTYSDFPSLTVMKKITR